MLYSAPPNYDVFERPESTKSNDAEESHADDGSTDAPASVMAEANWTGAVPADD